MPPSNLHVRVPASAARLTQSIEPVRAFLRAHKIDDRTARDILFCVHESCANAIKHGGSDEDVDVRVSLAAGAVHSSSQTAVVAWISIATIRIASPLWRSRAGGVSTSWPALWTTSRSAWTAAPRSAWSSVCHLALTRREHEATPRATSSGVEHPHG